MKESTDTALNGSAGYMRRGFLIERIMSMLTSASTKQLEFIYWFLFGK